MPETPTGYLAGPIIRPESVESWHSDITKLDTDVEWINPFDIHDDDATGKEIYERDLDALRGADAVLLRRPPRYELCGAYIEAGVADENEIPVIVWNEAETPVPEFLDWLADGVVSGLEDAVQLALAEIERSGRPPEAGGCWICKTGNGWDDSEMVFDWGFDTFVHLGCLEDHGVESVTEYEQQRSGENQ